MCQNKPRFPTQKIATNFWKTKFADITSGESRILCPIRIVLRNTSIAIVAKDELTFIEIKTVQVIRLDLE